MQNSLVAYIWALVLSALLVVVFKFFTTMLVVRLKQFSEKTKNSLDDALIQIIGSIKYSFYIYLSIWIGIKTLNIPDLLNKVVDTILIVWIVYVISQAVRVFVEYFSEKRRKENGASTDTMITLIKQILVGLVWMFGLLVLLSNVGVDITSLIAGLGIGGIAVALALQNILGDLFSSFAIFLDKPFQVGDFITVGKESGTVERIGIKTTRLRALQGEEIVISNRELTSARIQNFRKLEKRRVNFLLGVAYETSQESLKELPAIIQSIIEKLDKTEFVRAHLVEFGASALQFEIIYNVLSKEFAVYRDINQEILLGINQALYSRKIEIAYPTQTIHLSK